MPLFHALPKAVKQRYVRETIAVNNEIICHTCGKISTHVYGMVYHLERCGIEIEVRDVVSFYIFIRVIIT